MVALYLKIRTAKGCSPGQGCVSRLIPLVYTSCIEGTYVVQMRRKNSLFFISYFFFKKKWQKKDGRLSTNQTQRNDNGYLLPYTSAIFQSAVLLSLVCELSLILYGNKKEAVVLSNSELVFLANPWFTCPVEPFGGMALLRLSVHSRWNSTTPPPHGYPDV